MSLRVVFADRVERLWEALAERVRAREDPFSSLVIAVPSRVVERRAELAVARNLGIAASLTLTRLSDELEARTEAATGKKILGSGLCEALVRDALLTPERLESEALAPVRRYVQASTRALRERKACELAARLARLYSVYTMDRPELIAGWLRSVPDPGPNATSAWQGALLREVIEPFAHRFVPLIAGLDALPQAEPGAPLVVVGYSYFSRLEHQLLAAVSQRSEVLVLTPTPCAEFWEDATRKSATLSAESESTLLASWGTAAREHAAALDAATEYDAERVFATSDETTRIGRLQASIRERRPITPANPDPADRTLSLTLAPSLRREVETVAGEIWARVHRAARTDRPLRFPEIAVWIPSRDRDAYLTQIETVFAEANDIPWSGVDLALASRSRVVEALVRMVTAIAAGPSRAGLLDVVLHPLVLARVPGDPRPEAIALAIERLGVFFGSDASELPAAYASDPHAIDLGQAIERLALGAFMLGEPSGDPRFFERAVDGVTQRWLPEELDVDSVESVVALLRSFAADLASARAAHLPLEAWARFFVALAETYLVTEGAEQAEHRRAILALREIGGPSIEGGAELGCAAACNLALRALESLPASRGASDRGVLVGALGPHRASDHRLVFVLGLGEGRFPSRDPETGLDLRAGDRRACEVTAEDRDRLALLEAVVSTRDALLLSWVARDEQTGDDIARAHPVAELCEAMPDVPEIRPLLRRDEALLRAAESGDRDARIAALSLPRAETEARARTLGDTERSRWATSPLPLAELARDLPLGDERRTLLALEPIPPRAAPTSIAPVRVTIDEIRRFLDCSVQAAARRIVGRMDDDDGRLHDTEPFDLDVMTRTDLVRALVLASLDGTEVSVEALAAPRVAHGEFPLGAFGARARSLATEEAREVLAVLRAARPRARSAVAVRFGAGREHGDLAGRALDPIALATLPDGRALELVGTTAPLLSDGDEPLRFDLARARASEQRRVAELRLALHAFVDHAALVLGLPGAPRARRGVIVSRRGPLEVAFTPLRADLARKWLAGLAKDLVTEPQTAFMPIESVLRIAHVFTTGSGQLERDLVRSIEVVRGSKWEGGRSRWGPVREATKLAAPTSPARLAGQRFQIFFSHLTSPAIVPPKRGAK